MPHITSPMGFADALMTFVATSTPAVYDPVLWRSLLVGVDDEALAAITAG
jgi:hypothetical protein